MTVPGALETVPGAAGTVPDRVAENDTTFGHSVLSQQTLVGQAQEVGIGQGPCPSRGPTRRCAGRSPARSMMIMERGLSRRMVSVVSSSLPWDGGGNMVWEWSRGKTHPIIITH